jgi:branched-chain amino acid transport system permease protein
MGLERPSDYKDKALDWYAFFSNLRKREIVDLITDDVIAEHQVNPTGYRKFHSWRLQRILNYMRQQPVLGKYFVYTREPWCDYRIAAIDQQRKLPHLVDNQVFQTEEQAMHGVFLLRVKQLRESVR